MADVSAIAGLLSSFKAIGDISKAMLTLRDGQMMQDKVIELQGAILAAQQSAMQAQVELSGMHEENRALKAENAAMKSWAAEKAGYELMQLFRGPHAYIPREEGASYALCSNCFERGQKSILQSSGHRNVHEHFWHCPACKSKTMSQWIDMKALIVKTRAPAA